MSLRIVRHDSGGANNVTLVVVYNENLLFFNVPPELRDRFVETFEGDEANIAGALTQMFATLHAISCLPPGGLLAPVMMTIWREKLTEAIDAMQGILERVDKGEDPWTIFDEFIPLSTNLKEDQKSDENLDRGPFKDFIEGLDLTDGDA